MVVEDMSTKMYISTGTGQHSEAFELKMGRDQTHLHTAKSVEAQRP